MNTLIYFAVTGVQLETEKSMKCDKKVVTFGDGIDIPRLCRAAGVGEENWERIGQEGYFWVGRNFVVGGNLAVGRNFVVGRWATVGAWASRGLPFYDGALLVRLASQTIQGGLGWREMKLQEKGKNRRN